MGYAIQTSPEKPRWAKVSCSGKSASGDFFETSNEMQLANRCNPLKTRQKNSFTPTKTASGVHYYKYRHYKADYGRWPSRDPIEEKGGLNLYAFVDNDTVNKWDKLGLRMYIARGHTRAQIMEILSDLQRLTDDKLKYKTERDGRVRIKIIKLHHYGKCKPNGTRLIRQLNSSARTVTIDHNSGGRNTESDVDPTAATVGLDHVESGGITENLLRREQGISPRGHY